MSQTAPQSVLLVTAFFCIGTALSAQIGPFSFTTIDPPTSTSTQPSGINASGQVVGSYQVSGFQHGFLFSGGFFSDVAGPGSAATSADGINTGGQIVGQIPSTGIGFLLSGGTFSNIAPPTATTSVSVGINDSGQIVGGAQISGVNHGFLLSGGTYTTIDPPGSLFTVAHGINNSGQIVGVYQNATGEYGFVLSGGVFTTIEFPGSTLTEAFGINDSGQIVGLYESAGATHGFLLNGGFYSSIDVPSATYTSAAGINNSGQVVGTYETGGVNHGFLATPSPTITFGPLTNVTFGVAPFAISATASAPLTVAFVSMTLPVCTVSGNMVTIVAMGTCSIVASQSGAMSSPQAAPVTQSFTVNPAGVTLTSSVQSIAAPFSALGSSTGGFAPSLPVSFGVTPCQACGTWTASSSATWVIITSGATGTGAGSVSFSVLANTTTAARSATITITAAGAAAITLTVNEAASMQSMLDRETEALYQRSLGREPDPGGFNFWTCITPATVSPCSNLGVAGLGQMVDLFLQSQEGMSSDFQVLAIYQGILGRFPVFAEWSSAIAPFRANDTPSGWSAAGAALINTLINSSEYAGRYGSPGNTGNVVANLYQDMLNRQPSSVELSGGIATVGNSGVAGLFTIILSGAEFRNTGAYASTSVATDHSNNLFVTLMYYSILARDPDSGGYAFWVGIANGGGAGIYFQPAGSTGANTRLTIEGPGAPNVGLVGSIEFQSLFSN